LGETLGDQKKIAQILRLQIKTGANGERLTSMERRALMVSLRCTIHIIRDDTDKGRKTGNE